MSSVCLEEAAKSSSDIPFIPHAFSSKFHYSHFYDQFSMSNAIRLKQKMQNKNSPLIPYELRNKNATQPSNATLTTAMNRLAEALEKLDRGKANAGQMRSKLVAKASINRPENEWKSVNFLKESDSDDDYSEFDMELKLAQSSSSNNNSKSNTPEGVKQNVADKGAGGHKRGRPGRKPKKKLTAVIRPVKRTLEQIIKNTAMLPEYRGKD